MLSQVAILTGIMAYASLIGNNETFIGILHIVLWAVLLIIFEIIYQVVLRKDTRFGKEYNVMDMDEFNKRVAIGE